jgi:cell wall-associated NlpC family hydrolase
VIADYIGATCADERGCWELVRAIYATECQVFLPSYATEAGQLTDVIAQHKVDWLPVTAGDEQRLDAVLFRIAGEAMHIGVVVEPGSFIHVRKGRTAMVESYRAPGWRHRLEGFYRLP